MTPPFYRVTWVHPPYHEHPHTAETNRQMDAVQLFDALCDEYGMLFVTLDWHRRNGSIRRLRQAGHPYEEDMP